MEAGGRAGLGPGAPVQSPLPAGQGESVLTSQAVHGAVVFQSRWASAGQEGTRRDGAVFLRV